MQVDSSAQIDAQNNPFKTFFEKMQTDLNKWLAQEAKLKALIEDYTDTLVFLQDNFEEKKLLVEVGARCRVKAKRTNEKIILRCSDQLFVQFNRKEAVPTVKSLIGLNQEKVKACRLQISKIMASIREMEKLIVSYQQFI